MGYPIIYNDCSYEFFEKVRDSILAKIETKVMSGHIKCELFSADYSMNKRQAMFIFDDWSYALEWAMEFRKEKVPANKHSFEMGESW